jgi:hypothetical protein
MSQRQATWRRLHAGWLEIAACFGEVQTLLLLTIVYTLVLGPVALVSFALRRDLLQKRGLRALGSAWSEADTASADLERAKRLF